MIYFTAHTFKCVCHCRRAMFRVLGMYNFGRLAKPLNLSFYLPKSDFTLSRRLKGWITICFSLVCWGCQLKNRKNFFYPFHFNRGGIKPCPALMNEARPSPFMFTCLTFDKTWSLHGIGTNHWKGGTFLYAKLQDKSTNSEQFYIKLRSIICRILWQYKDLDFCQIDALLAQVWKAWEIMSGLVFYQDLVHYYIVYIRPHLVEIIFMYVLCHWYYKLLNKLKVQNNIIPTKVIFLPSVSSDDLSCFEYIYSLTFNFNFFLFAPKHCTSFFSFELVN